MAFKWNWLSLRFYKAGEGNPEGTARAPIAVLLIHAVLA